jgi:hypothetical protein
MKDINYVLDHSLGTNLPSLQDRGTELFNIVMSALQARHIEPLRVIGKKYAVSSGMDRYNNSQAVEMTTSCLSGTIEAELRTPRCGNGTNILLQ